MAPRKPEKPAAGALGHEAELWKLADALRGQMDAAEYKHVVLGLIFLKYISDAFEERYAAVRAEWGEAAAEDRDEYVAENIFRVPPEARWKKLLAEAKQPTVGQTVDRAMAGEGEIRKNRIEAGLVDCMVALPGQLFYSTQIPACLWFLARDRSNGKFRDRTGEILFLDARELGRMVDRTHRELTEGDIARIAGAYHAWRGEEGAGEYTDEPGFSKSATLEEVRRHDHVLTPGRYVGAPPREDDGEPFEEKMTRLAAEWREQRAEAARLDAAIEENLRRLGFPAPDPS